MNILVPDIWLKDFLKTEATPSQIKEYLSLCGPSVERMYGEGVSNVYDIEITGNRPDTMSIVGIAREAAAILPRFGIKAELVGDPYREKIISQKLNVKSKLTLTVKTDSVLNPRWMSVIFENVTIESSPSWLKKYLKLAGIRSLNNVVDITNFLMRAYGQPAHVFDYDQIEGRKMSLRASKKGETLVTLDDKEHILPGDDIVIEDESGKLIDLCGIMGGKNSSVTLKTKRVVLFVQTYDSSKIRKTSMTLAHRTEASGLFEKGLDTELVKPVFYKGIHLMTELTGGNVASAITDIYPKPYKTRTLTLPYQKIQSYIGNIDNKTIQGTLTSLGFTKTGEKISIPSYRRDINIDVDIVEEIARIYGYHNIPSRLPDSEPPIVMPDKQLRWEDEIKIRLRDWGFTEIITYSMLSEEQMNLWGFDMANTYRISNPLSNEWVYMRPKLWPGIIATIKQNINIHPDIRLFELGMVYEYQKNDLPRERPALAIAWTGHKFFEAKGIAETLFELLGIPFPEGVEQKNPNLHRWNDNLRLFLGDYGSVSEINPEFLTKLGITKPVTFLSLYVDKLVADTKTSKTYIPIPIYPPIIEDLSFIVPDRFAIGPLITALKSAHPLIAQVELLDVHENSRTFHITYQNPKKNLTDKEVESVRNKLIDLAAKKFGITLKG